MDKIWLGPSKDMSADFLMPVQMEGQNESQHAVNTLI